MSVGFVSFRYPARTRLMGVMLAELVRRGDVTAFSFGFSMPARGGDEWSA